MPSVIFSPRSIWIWLFLYTRMLWTCVCIHVCIYKYVCMYICCITKLLIWIISEWCVGQIGLYGKNGRIIQNQRPINCFTAKSLVLEWSLKNRHYIFESVSVLKPFFSSDFIPSSSKKLVYPERKISMMTALLWGLWPMFTNIAIQFSNIKALK